MPASAAREPSATLTWAQRLGAAHGHVAAALTQLQAPCLLLARWVVAKAFFLSGLTKLRDWDTTVALFTDEYQVPLLPPELAAVLGAGGELLFPVLLWLGLGGRYAALGLSAVNGVAVISVAEMAPAAFGQHLWWGTLLLGVALWGAGRWSVDAVIARAMRAAHPVR
ncbi:MAG: DoxX family protein [Leptothrix sp. (in: b-proteobacteria)]